MSFSGYKDLIESGDTVILYVNFNVMYPIVVEETKLNKNGEVAENITQARSHPPQISLTDKV